VKGILTPREYKVMFYCENKARFIRRYNAGHGCYTSRYLKKIIYTRQLCNSYASLSAAKAAARNLNRFNEMARFDGSERAKRSNP
jgi:hypothetical protein